MALVSNMIGSPYPSTMECLLFFLLKKSFCNSTHILFYNGYPELQPPNTQNYFLFERKHVYVPRSGYGVPTASITILGFIKIGSKAPQSLICEETVEYSFILL